jgi:hypothetical protein
MTTTLDPVSEADLLKYEEAEETPVTVGPVEVVPVEKGGGGILALAAGLPWAYFGMGALTGVGIGLAVGMFAGVRLGKGDDHSVRMGSIRPTVKLAPKFAPELEVKAFNNRQTWAFGRRLGAGPWKARASGRRARRRAVFRAIFGRRGLRALPPTEKPRVPFALAPFFRRPRAA